MTSDPTPAAHTLPTYDSRGIPVPLFPWIVNYGLDRFDYVASAIDALPGESTEWAKIPVLVNEPSYLTFLSELTGRSKSTIVAFLNDFADDRSFIGAFGPALAEVQSLPAAGDLRFHAITLYVIVRSARPTLMIETGVAHGKSSAFILLGMEHNGSGSLVLVDLPPDGALADGSLTTMHGRPTGWLVPEYLRHRWTLRLGDSVDLLPALLAETGQPDVFLHDSLHTIEHTRAEIEAVLASASEPLMLLADNIDMGSGYALAATLKSRRVVGHAFRDFGGALLPRRQ